MPLQLVSEACITRGVSCSERNDAVIGERADERLADATAEGPSIQPGTMEMAVYSGAAKGRQPVEEFGGGKNGKE